MIDLRVGRPSSNWRSDGSPARAAAATWYQPGIAHSVSRLHSSSDATAPTSATRTLVVTALRMTTLCVGIARGQCWLDQMSSGPDVILSVTRLRGDLPGAGRSRDRAELEDEEDRSARRRGSAPTA